MKVLVVSGLSGSGKTTAKSALEDLGYYCVDNLPVLFFEDFLLLSSHSHQIDKLALLMDVREKEFARLFPRVFQQIRAGGQKVELLFLEASEAVIKRRFSETRRPHPLAGERGLEPGIRRERKLLAPIRALADHIIDTSDFNVHQLKEFIRDNFGAAFARNKIHVNVISFGYRYGTPDNLNLLFDVRFLPNPYFRRDLKRRHGRDRKVAAFVLRSPAAKRFLRQAVSLIRSLVPLYEKEGKAYCSIGLGCTGGRHRSVVLAEKIAQALGLPRERARVIHRDLMREE
jgi:RNase adapter protein RapZ